MINPCDIDGQFGSLANIVKSLLGSGSSTGEIPGAGGVTQG